jgi:hypothetical protein
LILPIIPPCESIERKHCSWEEISFDTPTGSQKVDFLFSIKPIKQK